MKFANKQNNAKGHQGRRTNKCPNKKKYYNTI